MSRLSFKVAPRPPANDNGGRSTVWAGIFWLAYAAWLVTFTALGVFAWSLR